MRSRLLRLVAGAAILATAGLPSPAAAQAPPLAVERPSFSTPPEVVGPGFWQVEAGLAWERDAVGDDAVGTLTAPNVIVRLGMSRRLELRASTTGFVSLDGPRARTTSAADVEIGVKYQLTTETGRGVAVSLIPMVSLPTGGAASSGNADPSVILTIARSVNAASLNGNLKWSAPSIGDARSERARVLDWSLVLGHPIRGPWSVFWEGVATDEDTPGVPTRWQANAGLGRQLGEHLLVDVYGGVGLNDAAPDWRLGAGFGWRVRR